MTLILSGISAYEAVSNEITGKASRGIGRSGAWRRNEVFTGEDSPSKFREATNLLWGLSGFCLIVSVVSFWFYRKIDDDLDEYFGRYAFGPVGSGFATSPCDDARPQRRSLTSVG